MSLQLPIQSNAIINEIISADGDLELAAERLNISSAQLVASLADDPASNSSLQDKIKVVALLNIFSVLPKVKLTFETSLADMKPADTAKAFTSLLELLLSMVGTTNTQNINITEYVMRMLPQKEREALQILVNSPQ